MFDILGMLVTMGDMIFGGKKEPDKDPISEEKSIYHSDQIKPIDYSWTPNSLAEFVGNESAKKLVRLNLRKIKEISAMHFLITASGKGVGKSTLAKIIGVELNAHLSWHVGGSFNMDNLKNFLLCNESSGNLEILFIDEAHNLGMDKSFNPEILYPILENWTIPMGSNPKVKPFVCILATNKRSLLQKKFSPLCDRCSADIILDDYLPDEIVTILKQFNNNVYKLDISNEVYKIIADNTRGVPRIALNFLADFVICQDIKEVLDCHRIIKNGLTTTDILILKSLIEVGKPCGIEGLSQIAGVTREDFEMMENFLVRRGFLIRTPRGRLSTEKSKLLLQEIKNG